MAVCTLLAGILVQQTGVVLAQDFGQVEIETLHVSGNVYMLVGAGGNIAVSVGDDGVLIVDDQFAPLTDKILAAVRKLSDGPVTFLVNTHAHDDHIGGNANLQRWGALIIAHKNARRIMVEGSLDDRTPDPDDRIAPAPEEALPLVTFGEKTSIHFNGERVDLIPAGAAHTDGDIFVYFRGSNVLHMGDVLLSQRFPVVDRANNGSISGIIDALNLGLDLGTTAPGFLSGQGNQPGAWPDPSNGRQSDTIIIPGHGRLYDEADLAQYRDELLSKVVYEKFIKRRSDLISSPQCHL